MPAARIVSAAVQRADSLRSERSDASQANKRVSFNRDVDVKHINHAQQPQQQQHQQQQQQYIPRVKGPAPAPPVGSHNVDRHDLNISAAPSASVHSANHAVPPFYNVYKEPTLLSEAELAQEAERIIQQVDQISCTVASPNPHLLANYETRSLERRNLAASKRNNQVQGDNGLNWSRTLPTASTKNQLVNDGKASSGKKTKNIEQKNNILHQQQQQQQQQHQQQFDKLDPIIESSPRRPQQLPLGMMTILDQQQEHYHQQRNGKRDHNNRDTAPTTPPKYDSGIEMEATSRPNVNLIVQQLTEESRQRELLRRQYQDELNMAEDPLAPRLPTLNLIEPDPQFGLSHNKNLPFSYTGGVSPTRTSPLRSPLGGGPRFTSPPPPRPELPFGKTGGGGGVTDVVYAQVKTSAQHQGRGQSPSPERNVYRSSNGAGADKVPAGRGKLFQFQEQQTQKQTEVIRQHLGYPKGVGIEHDEEEEPEGPVDEEDLDAIKAKARFLFGDDGQGQQTERKLSGSSGNSRALDARNNNRNNVNNSHVQYNNNNNNGGLSFKYSTLLKDQQQQRTAGGEQDDHHPDRSYHHTTKILIAGNDQQQQQQQQRKQTRASDQRVFQYSDDEDGPRFGGRGGIKVYQDRSVSPEPRIQPLTNRIRSLQMQQQQQQQPSSRKSPERSYQQREPESRTLPLPQKANQMSMTSTRLIQDAERGRTVVRHRTEPVIHASRLTQFQSRYEDDIDGEEQFLPAAPKPPLRIKKLSRERMEASPPRTTTTGPASAPTTQAKVAFNTVPWRRDERSPESSPERNYPLNRPVSSKKMPSSPYRYQPARSSLTPSPERRVSDSRRWNEPDAPTAVQPASPANNEPEKQEKIRRQRNKFLSVFLGSKAGKSDSKKTKQPTTSPSVLSSPSVAPAAVIQSGPAVKEVRGQAPPQVAKWSAEDEAELVRQSRSLLVKGQSHQTSATKTTTANNNNNNNNNNKSSTNGRPVVVIEAPFVRKVAPQPPVTTGDAAALRYRVVTTSNGTSKDGGGHRRRSSTDRTDTSESDGHVNSHQRNQFKNLRQKSQSFNNLNYRPDPVIVLGEEHQHQNRGHRHNQDTSVQFHSGRRYQEDGGRYKPQQRGMMSDARPYASTNLIHQIGVESAELRDRNAAADEQQQQQQRRAGPTVPSANGPSESAPPPPAATSAAQSHRQMRYFGDTDLESQPSRGGGYSSRYMPKAKVLRSASSAAGMGAVRRGVLHQRGRHHPVSSVNSSESDGSAMQSAAGSAESQRSVYLHATTVADIPVTSHGRTAQQQLLASRRHKAQSREDMSALSGTTGSTLRRTQTRQISRSYSVLAPWKPRHYRDKYEITYSNQQQPGGQPAPAMVVGDVGKPPRAPVRRREDVIVESEDSGDAYRPSAVAQRQTGATSSSKTGGTSVSRSSTMPKNSKLMAGWFRKKKR
ncbi:hypothetical protein GHT06_015781 [Daphnia sinensis]|uniref:Uncharacterized protein n=1 Tax=Daphnia sinensis TaxID=1820382 RepID=A0AAD5PTP9_9CRUS|nr:hypothetical protein GHT06_015781 [Daphnia sinensis]